MLICKYSELLIIRRDFEKVISITISESRTDYLNTTFWIGNSCQKDKIIWLILKINNADMMKV